MTINYKVLDREVYSKRDDTYYCFRLSFPLNNPYKLSFDTIEAFDTIYIIRVNGGRMGIGEVTALPGYSHESISDLWGIQNNILKNFNNLNKYEDGFKTVAFKTCLESYDKNLFSQRKKRSAKCARIFESEYNVKTPVIKIKIGKNVDTDIEKVKEAQKHGYKIRVDANQGYTLHEAMYFLDNISPDNMEFIEQLLRSDRLDQMYKLKLKYDHFNFLLDESIFTKADLKKITQRNISKGVKLKLFKHGSIARTIDLATSALTNGLQVVLGNGVQTVVGAFYEIYCYNILKNNHNFNEYSEINGPFKIRGSSGNTTEDKISINPHDIKLFAREMISN